ncbi:hypothetical protein Sjap_000312 [Stephania japonica]|uniref:PRA1 family protein n=1 Tax=Stephania japonica TaxID=461633 RepID=A0AAP0KHT9_9MAGN
MTFSANPLSLSVPEPAFESWLRDSGYLEILDDRTAALDRRSSAAANNTSSTAASTSSSRYTTTTTTTRSVLSVVFAHLTTLLSLFTLNPFAKLSAEDFSGDTPSWTAAFIGDSGSYSVPSSPAQARLRVHENVKRYARNYSTLFIVFFACSLYQIPVALLGSISSLVLWDLFRLGCEKWGLDGYPSSRQLLIRLVQCATAVVLYCSNVQLAFFCAVAIVYAVMILHASLRKLSPLKQPSRAEGPGHRRFLLK